MKRILIIEDDKFIGGVYSNRLQGAGYQTELAVDGEAGIQRIAQFKPDLVQLDLSLPKVNGIDVIRWIRNHQEFQKLPVIVLTNGYVTDLVKHAWEAGATKVLTKSQCTPNVMLEIVNQHLASAPVVIPMPPASTPSGTPVTPAPKPPEEDDLLFQAELRKTFLETSQREISSLRALHHSTVKAATPEALLMAYGELRRKVRSVANNAGVVGFAHLGRLASALEALLREFGEKTGSENPSSKRTVAQAIDRIGTIIQKLQNVPDQNEREPRILVVDDDLISRKAVNHALNKVGLNAMSVEDPQAALGVLSENRFDLVILDVDMPIMSGLDLCKQMRTMPLHTETPVIFVTSLSDFNTRAQTILIGGVADLIGKPFPFLELGVKALIYLYRGKY